MYTFSMAGEDFKRLQKILTWSGKPGTKHPEKVHFVSNDRGVFIWVNNDFCETIVKIHGPIGDHSVRATPYDHWKQTATLVKKDYEVKFRVKKAEINASVGQTNRTMYCTQIEESPNIEIIDAMDISPPSIYFKKGELGASKIAFSAKSVVSTIFPLIWHDNYLISPSSFYTKAVTSIVPFKGTGAFSQGFLRIPLETNGGVTAFSEDGCLCLSAIDFTCRFKPQETTVTDEEISRLMGGDTLVDIVQFPSFAKITERNAYVRSLSLMLPSSKSITAGDATVSPTPVEGYLKVSGPTESVTIPRSELVLVLRNMVDTVTLKAIRSGRVSGAVFYDSNKDKIVAIGELIA